MGRKLSFLVLAELFVTIAFLFFGAATARAEADSRCFCRPYTGLGPNGHELIYVDRDGRRHFIYAYATYGECASGLGNTALCGNESDAEIDLTTTAVAGFCDEVARYCWQQGGSLAQYRNCMWSQGCRP